LGKEKKIKDNNSYTRVMSILASGAVRSKEAFDYIGSLEGVDSVVLGASSPSHITETKELSEAVL
jgi:hypothetical protein